jgi:hypothetical protein
VSLPPPASNTIRETPEYSCVKPNAFTRTVSLPASPETCSTMKVSAPSALLPLARSAARVPRWSASEPSPALLASTGVGSHACVALKLTIVIGSTMFACPLTFVTSRFTSYQA